MFYTFILTCIVLRHNHPHPPNFIKTKIRLSLVEKKEDKREEKEVSKCSNYSFSGVIVKRVKELVKGRAPELWIDRCEASKNVLFHTSKFVNSPSTNGQPTMEICMFSGLGRAAKKRKMLISIIKHMMILLCLSFFKERIKAAGHRV